MLKSSFSGEVMVFAKEYNGRTFYSIGLSKKLQDGTYENGYMDVVFKKGVEVPNKTKINITEGWLTFYNKDKRTVQQIFISKFETESGFIPMDDSEPCPF